MTEVINRWTDDDLRRLLLIRAFEETVLRLFSEGRISGTTHTCLGQEYVPVALSALLRPDDFVLSNHRGHGHYLARHDDPEGLLAELMGRKGAVCNGAGGSQHLYRGGYLSTGVQGQNMPVAAGIALHFRQTGGDRIAVVFIGDGTWGEGAVYEALNITALWSLPVLVVVENNGIAQSTPVHTHLAGSIQGRASAFGLDHHRVRGCDLGTIREQLARPVQRARQGRPAVVEFETVRLGPHSKGDDTRGDEEMAEVWSKDWYAHYRRAFPDQVTTVERQVRARMEAVTRDVCDREPADGGILT